MKETNDIQTPADGPTPAPSGSALEAVLESQYADEDRKMLTWLASRFSGTFRNSIFIANEYGDGEMLVMDERKTPGVVHRAKTLRGLIKLAMEHEQ